MSKIPLPPAVVSGLRPCHHLVQVEMKGGPSFIEPLKRWAIHFTIALDSVAKHQDIPVTSHWFLVLDPSYPLGSVEVYPAKKDGVSVTFPHQDLNKKGANGLPWRTGKICLESPSQRLGLIATGPDPIGETEERAKWYLERAIAWVQAAASQSLVKLGDPFELPYYPNISTTTIVHNESVSSFGIWQERQPGEIGTVVFEALPDIRDTIHAVAFFDSEDNLISFSPRYNAERHAKGVKDRQLGAWWIWPKPTIIPPWQTALTWGELRQLGAENDIDVDQSIDTLKQLLREVEDKFVLVGYPIPTKCGEDASELHWQGILFPHSNKTGRIPNGFRDNPLGRNLRDRFSIFADTKAIKYLQTCNWHPDRMQARGRFDAPLQNSKIALIGCGALGSAIADLLIRGGIQDLLLIDHDTLYAENLVRHTLSGRDIGDNKALALARKLTSVAPFSCITPYQGALPEEAETLELLLNDRHIILDCTAMDNVVLTLGITQWSIAKLFISASVGYEAKRCFFFAHRGHSFPVKSFREKITPVLRQEQHHWVQQGETLQGNGCWSPIFPARLDDILLSASSGVKVIEELVNKSKIQSELIVFEQAQDNGFCGFKRVDVQAKNSDKQAS